MAKNTVVELNTARGRRRFRYAGDGLEGNFKNLRRKRVASHHRQHRVGRFIFVLATALISVCSLISGKFSMAASPNQPSTVTAIDKDDGTPGNATTSDTAGRQSKQSTADEGATKSESSETSLAEIMVTAQRRSESAQSVPISLQVVTGAQLQQQHIVDTPALAGVSPSLNFEQGFSPGASAFSLRGITSLSENAGVQPSTALVVDDVPVVRQGEYVAQLSDIQNIQILNGPQGTLFGKNSDAGVISIVTAQPSHEWEAWLEGGATTENGYSTRGMINVPLSDQIQTRVNFYYQNLNPIVPNRDGPGVDGDVANGIEGKLAYQVNSRLNVLAKFDYSQDESSFIPFIPIHVSAHPGNVQVLGYTPQFGDAFVNQDQQSLGLSIDRNGMLRLTYDISDAWRLTSISSYHHYHVSADLDQAAGPLGNILGVGFPPNPTNYGFVSLNDSLGLNRTADDTHYWSEEDRFNYDSSNLKVVTGIFYQNVDGFYRQDAPIETGGTTYSDNEAVSHYFDKTASVFGDVTYSVIDSVNVFAGARYTHEQTFTDYDATNYLNPISDFNGATGVNSAPPVSREALDGGLTVNNVSGRAGIQWQPTSDTNLYASYARGYKGPGISTASGVTSAQFLSVNPETADDEEIGIKQRLFERHLGLEFSIFNETIYGIQETSLVPDNPTESELLNAGNLRSKGVTGAIDAVVTSHLDLKADFAFLDNFYENFEFSCNPQQPVGVGNCRASPSGVSMQSLGGQPAIDAPRFKGTLTADYHDRVPGMPVTYLFELNYVWTAKIQYSLNQDPDTVQPGFGILNASADFKTDDGRWDFLLYGKNLTNRFHYNNFFDSPTAEGVVGQLPADYRIFGGFTLRYHF
jgi:iron complex outermembrane recepter protein